MRIKLEKWEMMLIGTLIVIGLISLIDFPTRVKIADFLNITIFNGKFLFMDLWSLIHLGSGTILMFLISKNKFHKKIKLNKYVLLFILLVIYEIFELLFIITGSNLFRGEPKINIIYDLIYGMVGGLLINQLAN